MHADRGESFCKEPKSTSVKPCRKCFGLNRHHYYLKSVNLEASLIRTPDESKFFIRAQLKACAVYSYKRDTLQPIYYRRRIPLTDRDTTKNDSLKNIISQLLD